MAKRNKKKKWIVTLFILVVAAAFLTNGFGFFAPDTSTIIDFESPSERNIKELVTANAKVQPVSEVKISPDVSGEIVELNVKEGDKVEKGMLILKIKPDVYESMKERTEASVNSSKARKQQTEVQLDQARTNLERNKILYQQEVIMKTELDDSQTTFDNLTAQLKMSEFDIESAEAALKESLENLQKTIIYSPTSGTVSLLSVELGERVVGTGQMAGTEMLRIADLTKMEARADVNENDIVRVSLGDTANVEIDSYGDRIFKGVVTQIANSAKGGGGDQVTNFEVMVYLLPESYSELFNEKTPNPLRPGMSCTVNIITNDKTVLSVPVQSVTLRNIDQQEKEVVFLYSADSSKVNVRAVKTGIQDTKYIEIEGVSKDDKVVSGPYVSISKTLKDNDVVRSKSNNNPK